MQKNSCCASWLIMRWIAVTLSGIGGGSRKPHPLGHRSCPWKFPGGDFGERFPIFSAVKAVKSNKYSNNMRLKVYNKRYKTHRYMDKTVIEPDDIFEDDDKVYSGLLEED